MTQSYVTSPSDVVWIIYIYCIHGNTWFWLASSEPQNHTMLLLTLIYLAKPVFHTKNCWESHFWLNTTVLFHEFPRLMQTSQLLFRHASKWTVHVSIANANAKFLAVSILPFKKILKQIRYLLILNVTIQWYTQHFKLWIEEKHFVRTANVSTIMMSPHLKNLPIIQQPKNPISYFLIPRAHTDT